MTAHVLQLASHSAVIKTTSHYPRLLGKTCRPLAYCAPQPLIAVPSSVSISLSLPSLYHSDLLSSLSDSHSHHLSSFYHSLILSLSLTISPLSLSPSLPLSLSFCPPFSQNLSTLYHFLSHNISFTTPPSLSHSLSCSGFGLISWSSISMGDRPAPPPPSPPQHEGRSFAQLQQHVSAFPDFSILLTRFNFFEQQRR